MIIRDIRTISVECTLLQPVFDANYIMATKPALLVEVETDGGLIGLGKRPTSADPSRRRRASSRGNFGRTWSGRIREMSNASGSRCINGPTSTLGAAS